MKLSSSSPSSCSSCANSGPGDGESDYMIELMEKSKYYDDEDEYEAEAEDGNIESLLRLFINYV
jgi:hypothetical protein